MVFVHHGSEYRSLSEKVIIKGGVILDINFLDLHGNQDFGENETACLFCH
jgi:hypothetical protein